MIFDAQTRLSGSGATATVGQAITGTAVSSNAYDCSTVTVTSFNRDIGNGSAQVLVSATVAQTFNNLTSLQLNIITSPNADLSGASIVQSSPAIPLASLTAGKRILSQYVPITGLAAQRYLGLQYVVAGTAPTTGSVTADAVLMSQTSIV